MQIPDQNRNFSQPNIGENYGNLAFTYGIDLKSNKGKIRVSERTKELINSNDETDFSGYAGNIFKYAGSGGKVLAVSDRTYIGDPSDITAGLAQDTDGSPPTGGNTVVSGCEFNGLALVSDGTNIKSYNGSTWSSFWQGTLGQSALATGNRRFMRVGPNGNLYITDGGNKVYRVRYTGTYSVSTTGNGTLDLSATSYKFTAMEPSSTRMWLGTENPHGKAVIVEWDMSANASSPNKLHEVGAEAVRCIFIHNDIPHAVLSTGKIVAYNGISFSEVPGFQFPVKENHSLSDSFIHPNGWAIIDGLPHLLVSGIVEDATDTYTGNRKSNWIMPSGVYCVDSEIGVYLRYQLRHYHVPFVGALMELDTLDTKFLASYEYYDKDKNLVSVLDYHDRANSQATTAYLASSWKENFAQGTKDVTLMLDPLALGESIRVFYRDKNEDSTTFEGVWASKTQFNVVGVDLGIEKGNIAFVKVGNGSSELLRVEEVNESSNVTGIVFDQQVSSVTAQDLGVIEVLNFKYIGTFNSTTLDEMTFGLTNTKKAKKTQVLLEINQNPSHKIQLDYCIIN